MWPEGGYPNSTEGGPRCGIAMSGLIFESQSSTVYTALSQKYHGKEDNHFGGYG
jgi:hypothetical protein